MIMSIAVAVRTMTSSGSRDPGADQAKGVMTRAEIATPSIIRCNVNRMPGGFMAATSEVGGIIKTGRQS